MNNFFQHYVFFTLALMFCLPGILIWATRPELRRVIIRIIPLALPFACTEFLFYPSYWEPNFLFDLGNRIGFGIEDIIFVAGLASFTSTVYAFVLNRNYKSTEKTTLSACALRALGLFVFSALLFLGFIITGVSVIYATCIVMIAATSAMLLKRANLAAPALIGGCLSAATYFILCLAAEKLMPGLFKNIWHTDKFLNIFIVAVPLEEILYGFSAGLVGTVFYPYVFGRKFISRTARKDV